MTTADHQEAHYQKARASLQQALNWYGSFRRHGRQPPSLELQAAVRRELQSLKAACDQLETGLLRLAVFGLVSRGKSAVINALLGEPVLPTGPLHGVTTYPRAVRWTPPGGQLAVELTDTPGLDEIDGQSRDRLAREIAHQADLILFVVAGDLTRTEYEALCDLRQQSKPILLVFNKIDLYPERDRAAIYAQLQQLAGDHELPLRPTEIVCVAAAPAAVPVRIEWQDGRVTYEQEAPPPQLHELRAALLTILNREGRSLLALNALNQAVSAERQLAAKTVELRQAEAEALLRRYTRYKALIVALNPIALFDVLGGAIADLALIRSLARLYGLPMTSYEASRLWRKIIASAGGVLLSEMLSALLVGLGKSAAAAASALENPSLLTAYASAAVVQGGAAGYGAYVVGKAAQRYLEQGCSWGPLGPSAVMQEILAQVEPDALLYRLREELRSQLDPFSH
ncbi:MAG: DUF697 domain-containing protein [Spirulinaceae cyanobacterium SM2_1_0]|nr:DUF697 domain-containing protein [Spirulinaceae cyanobacterium SM2_1_0]